jgi:sugar phosphate isomerase/epimerase
VSFGVVDFRNDEAAGRRLFEFGKALGLENFSAEPDPDALDLLDKLANEFSIRIAIHNHPSPSRYWNPDVVLAAVRGRGPLLGACADTGHWTRSGLVPVECLKKLEGRVIELHFKDLNEFGKHDAIDVPWGTGRSDARGSLAELKRQRFQGLISVEYETGDGAELERNVSKCVDFFDRTARELSAPTR